MHFHTLSQEIHRQLHVARRAGASDPLTAAADAIGGNLRLIAIDEMEITEIADAMVIGRVVAQMLSKGTSLVMTSNSAPQDLYRDPVGRDVFQHFVRLIESSMSVWHLGGAIDYRRHGANALENYLTPLDAEAGATMDKLWRAIGGDAAPVTIGRSRSMITLRSNRLRALRAGFGDLCAGPMSVSDYVEVAGLAEIVMIDDIPRLSAKHHNEARRFVLLIDILYEAGRALAVSAVDLPERIYANPEAAGAISFARTASRLRQMTSCAWPASSLLRGAGLPVSDGAS